MKRRKGLKRSKSQTEEKILKMNERRSLRKQYELLTYKRNRGISHSRRELIIRRKRNPRAIAAKIERVFLCEKRVRIVPRNLCMFLDNIIFIA